MGVRTREFPCTLFKFVVSPTRRPRTSGLVGGAIAAKFTSGADESLTSRAWVKSDVRKGSWSVGAPDLSGHGMGDWPRTRTATLKTEDKQYGVSLFLPISLSYPRPADVGGVLGRTVLSYVNGRPPEDDDDTVNGPSLSAGPPSWRWSPGFVQNDVLGPQDCASSRPSRRTPARSRIPKRPHR